MDDQKEIIHELETELQHMNVKEVHAEKKAEEHGEDHHSKKHIAIIILLTVLLVAILIIIAIVFRPSQKPEDVLLRLESVSNPVTQTVDEFSAEMEVLAESRMSASSKHMTQEEQTSQLQERQSELDSLGSL
jgi:flagellar basal body-associated protein FliL